MAQDSSLQIFWDSRYQKDVTPWESVGLPDGFAGYVAALPVDCQQVLIPGCGAAPEIAFLLAQGRSVLAIDFSAEAVQRARDQLGLDTNVVREADFFSDDVGGQWDWIYERAFLCALPPKCWPDYVAKMASLIKPGGLLAGYFFLRPTLKGPPFGMRIEALHALLGKDFVLREQWPVQDSLPVFADGEYWMCWERVVI